MPENHNFNLDKDRQIFSNDILTVTKEKIPNINANICSDDNNLLKATPYIQSDNKSIIEKAETIISDAKNDLQKVKELIKQAVTGGCSCPRKLPCVCGAVRKGVLPHSGKTPSNDEIQKNRRAKSARMRVLEGL